MSLSKALLVRTFAKAEKRQASKMNKIRSTAGSEVQNHNELWPSTSTTKPSSECKNGGKRKSSGNNYICNESEEK